MAHPHKAPLYYDLIGKPFLRGARGPHSYDCYGLVIELYRRIGITIPDFDSPGEIEAIEQLLDKESKRWKRVPFDTECAVVTMRLQGIRSHVGFILPNDRFIHASEEVGVGIDRLSLPPFDRAKIGAYVYE